MQTKSEKEIIRKSVDILIEQKAKVFGDFDDVFDVYDLLEL
jgi:hypothetical protein